MTFADIGLHPAILKALTDSGYSEPTPVQKQAIPAALEGRDLMVSSQTGSGKTAAFMLPALHRFASLERAPEAARPPASQERRPARSRGNDRQRFQPAQPKMLVLTPTRELALQVTAATEKYGRQVHHVHAVAILGGMPYPKQMELLGRNPAILVATPGRLIDHMNSGKIDFSQLQVLVLDEADRMLDMGFIEDIEKIVSATPTERQTMLFSATLDGTVGEMAKRMTRNALQIRVDATTARHDNIEQRMHFVDDLSHKNRLLDHLLRDASIDQAVVFTATKRDADTVSDRLNVAGLNAAALHGDMHQGARNRTLTAMRRGQVRILVATDVAARGIDVPTITHVFNYDLPKFAEDYVHRIGRTGRAGRNGLAISLVHHAEHFNVRKIERFTKQLIPVAVVEGHEPTRRPSPAKPRPTGKPGWKGGDNRQGKPFAPRREGLPRTPHHEGPKSGHGGGGGANANRRAYGDR
ncbi:DEAD/DEAH box helicase [Candidatus Accumulibacter phosphatis]|jgi:superfamily II DNA/RNA helicase|uniref:DEAD/DEAH box helicase n=1 Tax=Candidatus Accumulibacter phosphatis TaxID=327160 RepID=A0ABX1TQ55_9PROT|nr:MULTISPECIES: DEAD/DEAH box helicase [Candidatus Accumulibacter]NMQ26366.1 DEAD/DEAH box helicase [Candidatus Accumulibacter phosphatis]